MSATPIADLIEQMFMQRVAAMKEKDEGIRMLHLKSVKETKVKIEAALKKEPKAPIERIEVALPDWLPLDSWYGYVEMREAKKRPLTPRAIQLSLSKLDQFRSQGESLEDILDNSTVHGWLGLFAASDQPKRANEGSFV